jgi:sec-independent protein translocase protein TatC
MAELQHRRHDSEEDDNGIAKMGFLEHLDELRTRLIRCCAAVAMGMVVALLFVGRLSDFVLRPALLALPPDTSLIMTRPGEGVSFYLDIALIGGVVLSAPFVTYQVWCFIAPGLYAREKRLLLPFAVLATSGTLAGALFTHYALFPSMMAFFGTFESPHVRFTPRLEETFELYRNMVLGMVAVFQIPTLVFFLARMQLVTAQFLWRHLNYATLVSFALAAVLTPSSDPWNQALFAAPMLGLYVISIGIAWMVAPRGGRPAGSHLELVVAATVIRGAQRRRGTRSTQFPRLLRPVK